MNVTSILMRAFMAHADTLVQLPERGLVLVTGENGSGKSSLVEAVATAGWGKTLRGTSPWSGKGKVEVSAPAVDMARTYNGRSKKLDWCLAEGEPSKFETTTAAQEALEAVIGPYDVWRRTHVFSSQDASHFTMATDAERKRLLETLFGLDKFDPALAACRSDRKAAESKLREASSLLEQLKSQRSSAMQRLSDARAVLGTIEAPLDVSEAQKRRVELGSMLANARDDSTTLSTESRDLDRAVSIFVATHKEAKRRQAALGEGDCDKCGQPIPQALVDELTGAAASAGAATEKARATADARAQEVSSEYEEIQGEVDDLRAKMAALDEQVRAADAARKQRTAAEQSVDRAETALDGLDDRIDNGEDKVAELRVGLDVLRATEEVLGTRGVRAHVLGSALGGLEEAANAWLARIVGLTPYEGPVGGGAADVEDVDGPLVDGDADEVEAMLGGSIFLRLRPYTEKKTGGASAAISMEILGAGGGHGYKGASGGERRRIDVALLMALAEVASAAHGQSGGTLFFDEVMDSLDAEGVDRVATVMQELAQERTVVVISHNPDLQRALHPVMWLEAAAGEFTQIL